MKPLYPPSVGWHLLSSAWRRIARPAGAGLVSVLGLIGACAGSVPANASCSASSDCETGLACLYALGSGCSASGHCAVPARDCSGTSVGLVLCGCGDAIVDLSCVPSSVVLAQRTATGAACPHDAGSDRADDAR